MGKIKKIGYAVEVSLKKYGYDGYSVECIYKYNKNIGKYWLRMGIRRRDMEDRFRIDPIDLHNIDAQYISGTKETIIENIDRIVEYAAYHEDTNTHEKFFDKYIARIEYECRCSEIGNEVLENERLQRDAD